MKMHKAQQKFWDETPRHGGSYIVGAPYGATDPTMIHLLHKMMSFKPRGKNFLRTYSLLEESDCSGDSRLIDYSPEYEAYNEDDPQETTDFG